MERKQSRRVFTEPKDPRLVGVLNSRRLAPGKVIANIDRDMTPLVNAFAEQLMREEGLRDDIVVGPPGCGGCNRVDFD